MEAQSLHGSQLIHARTETTLKDWSCGKNAIQPSAPAGSVWRPSWWPSQTLLHHLKATLRKCHISLTRMSDRDTWHDLCQPGLAAFTHSLTSRPSSMTVGDCRWPLYCLSSPLFTVLWHLLQLNVATATPLFYVVHPLSFGSSLVT